MTYGLKVYAGNNILQIDSDRTSAYGLITTSSGVASSLSFDTANTLVFANPGATGYLFPQWNVNKTSVTFKNNLNQTTNAQYILAKPGDVVSGDVGTRTYGLQILATNGTTVVFDSRAFANAGFAPVKVISAGSISPSNTVITTNVNYYVCMNPFWYTGNVTTSGGIYRGASNIVISSYFQSNAWFDIIVVEKLT